MPAFDHEITDLRGFVLATTRADRAGTAPGGADPVPIRNYSATEVAVELDQLRTAQVQLAVDWPAAEELYFDGVADGDGNTHRIAALGRMLRTYIRGKAQPVFWDVIDRPQWNARNGQVLVSAKQRPRLMKHFARYGDTVVGASTDPHPPDSPLDYRTIRNLVAAAENTATQNNYPPLGVELGSNDAPLAGATVEIPRGTNIFDEIGQVQEARYGPDWEIEPRDDRGICQTDDDGNTWPYYARLNTFEKQGTDRSATLVFRYVAPQVDATPNNLADFDWDPGGDVVRNEVTVVTQGTDTAPGHRVFGHDLGSWRDIGIYADWQNPEGGNSEAVTDAALQDLANDIVAAYSRPPNFFTLQTRIENARGGLVVPRYGIDYFIGDEVMAIVAKHGMAFSGVARITKVTVRQVDSAGNVQTDIEVTPKVTSQSSIATGADD